MRDAVFLALPRRLRREEMHAPWNGDRLWTGRPGEERRPRHLRVPGEAVMLWLGMLLLGLLAFGAMHAFIRLCDRV
jgi:hypothetical protein